MEICKENYKINQLNNKIINDARRFSTCSFSTFNKISYCEDNSESDSNSTNNNKLRKDSYFYLSSYEELNACRKFTPKIIVSSSEKNCFDEGSLKIDHKSSFLSCRINKNFGLMKSKNSEVRQRFESGGTYKNMSYINRKSSKFAETKTDVKIKKQVKFLCFKDDYNVKTKSANFYNGRSYSFNVYQDNNNCPLSETKSNSKSTETTSNILEYAKIDNNNKNIYSADINENSANTQNEYKKSFNHSKKITTNRADCIRKRIKTHFNQYMLRKLNYEIRKFFPSISLNKLSQRFIADVKIESNKHYIELPVKNVFTFDFKGSKNHLSNKIVVDKILESNINELKYIINKTYSDYFAEYLNSDYYVNDLKKFIIKEGENYAYLYKKFSKELIEYYRNGTPYKRRSSSIIETC